MALYVFPYIDSNISRPVLVVMPHPEKQTEKEKIILLCSPKQYVAQRVQFGKCYLSNRILSENPHAIVERLIKPEEIDCVLRTVAQGLEVIGFLRMKIIKR